MKIISCPTYIKLARLLSENVTEVHTKAFSSSEVEVHIHGNSNIKECEIYILYSLAESANNQLIELLLTINTIKNMGAAKIHVIIPYMPYSRQDKNEYGSSYGIELVAQMLSNSGLDSIITVDIHSKESLRLFTIPITNIDVTPLFKNMNDKTIVFPDEGSRKRYNLSGISMIKKRKETSMEFELSDDVTGKDCLIVDDIIDTGRTIDLAAQKLISNGARSVSVYATHGLFGDLPHHHNIYKSLETHVQEITITNSVTSRVEGVKVLDISRLLMGAVIG